MIKITNTEVFGIEHAIRGMRNPMNSWDKSDSVRCCTYVGDCRNCPNLYECPDNYGKMTDISVGPDDLKLMKALSRAGTDHRKFMRMITVYVDITAPLYWWKEFDTYKVGTVANSCSTMHKISEKEFTIDDFSHEHLNENGLHCLARIIQLLNENRELYLETKDGKFKSYWWQMIQLLPSSYNQKRTVMMNYEVLANIVKSRKGHKLDEWRDFINWVILELPYIEIILGKEFD